MMTTSVPTRETLIVGAILAALELQANALKTEYRIRGWNPEECKEADEYTRFASALRCGSRTELRTESTALKGTLALVQQCLRVSHEEWFTIIPE